MSINVILTSTKGIQIINQPVIYPVTTAKVINGNIVLTLGYHWTNYPLTPIINVFTVTASGTAVTPTTISTSPSDAVVTLTVPTSSTTDNNQPIYIVSYKGEDPVVANTQVTDTKPNKVKVGQNFNVVTYEGDFPAAI